MKSRKLISLALAGVLSLSVILSSCGSSDGGADTDTNDADTTATVGITPVPDGVDVNYVMDYLNEDLDAYVTLGEYKGLSVTVDSYEVDDEYIDEQINSLLESSAVETRITDRKTAEGDTINVDYSGSLDGVAFDGGTATDQSVTLTEDSGYIPGFAEGMYDRMPGEEFSYNVTFPEDYSLNADLAGKEVVFTVTVNYIVGDPVVPELDDAFVAEKFGEEGCTTVEEFMTYYKSYLEDQKEESEKGDTKSKVWDMIMENATTIALPDKAVDAMYWATRSQYEELAVEYGMTYENFMTYYVGGTDEEFRTYCEDYIKEDIVIYQIVKAEGLEITDDEYKAGVADFAVEYELSEEELVEKYTETRIRSVLQWNKLQDAVYSWSNVTVNIEE